MKKKVGVLMSGCGVFDGCEIHEAVLTLLFLDRQGAEAVCIAPDIQQTSVINHLTQEEMKESRNVLVESARIARGEIKNLKDIKSKDLDALIIPGGFGAAKNLSEFAIKGPGGSVNDDTKRLLEEMFADKKPIGALCIAPATVAMVFKDKSPTLSVGMHEETIQALKSMGVKHETCMASDIVTDEVNRIVSSPAYMVGPGIKEVAEGIEKLVQKIISMI